MPPFNVPSSTDSPAEGVTVSHSIGSAPMLIQAAIMSPRSLATMMSLYPPVRSNSASAGERQQWLGLTVEHALAYLDQIKSTFSETCQKPHKYNDFLDIMKEFKTGILNTRAVKERVTSLFQGHPELILGFNAFLPRVEPPPPEQVDGQFVDSAMTLVRKYDGSFEIEPEPQPAPISLPVSVSIYLVDQQQR